MKVNGSKLSLTGGTRRNVLTLGVSAMMLPTRSCPRHFAVAGGAASGRDEAAGGEADAGGVATASWVAESAGEGGGAIPAGGMPPVGCIVGEGLGAPASGGEAPGGGVAPATGSMRPKRAAVRRILKKYMAIIASANAMRSTIVKR